MGRGRLRRGYSLEVIFEEDTDFCSHLDSLDSLSVAFRFGVKEADDTISVDSLVEEYQIRFQNRANKEQVFRSFDGVWDVRDMESSFVEWDEFSTESMSNMAPGAEKQEGLLDAAILDTEIGPSGRRSRVSRRQIVEASWMFDSDESSSNDNENDNDSTTTEIDKEPEIEPLILKNTPSGHPDSNSGHTLNNSKIELEISSGGEENSPPRALFGHGQVDGGGNNDTLDSYISTRTDDTNVYNFADPFDDTHSVASTNLDSSTSTSSTGSVGSVCTVNDRLNNFSSSENINSSSNKSVSPCDQIPTFRTNLSIGLQQSSVPNSLENGTKTTTTESTNNNKSDPSSSLSICTDLKRVRALFEIPKSNNSNSNSRKSSYGDESSSTPGSSPTGQSSSSTRLYSKNPVSPTNSNASSGGGSVKKLKQLGQLNTQNEIVNKVLRSAYSQFNLNQIPSNNNNIQVNRGQSRGQLMDFAELLVNDKVVIEDNPDLFQTLRKRHKEAQSSQAIGCNSTLRRSKSMGAGICGLGDSVLDKLHATKTSRTSILAEEMPAPDTVKNVRTVFEQMLKIRAAPQSQQNRDASLLQNGHTSLSSNNSFSIIKKSLSSVKSNPTSKIYRSESMRDNFPGAYNSSSLMIIAPKEESSPLQPRKNNPDDPSTRKHLTVERKCSEPIKFSPKINSPVTSRFKSCSRQNVPEPQPLTEEDFSLLSSLSDSDNPPKFVSPDVLQRIRSWGTSTTYFGGEIVARTVKNRKIPAARRHTVMDFQDFNPHDYPSSPSGTPTRFMNNDYDYNYKEVTPVKAQKGKISPMDLDSIFSGVSGLSLRGIDTTPRIISVVPKSPSQSGSPTKSCSPVGSIIEGRNSPEGCESHEDKCIWINEIPVGQEEKISEFSGVRKITPSDPNYPDKQQDGNNNEIGGEGKIPGIDDNQVGVDKMFSQVAEGAWF